MPLGLGLDEASRAYRLALVGAEPMAACHRSGFDSSNGSYAY
jgi:hypothetical protein